MILWKFVFFGLLGLVVEVVFTSVKALLAGEKKLVGHTSLWMFPIYGLIAFFYPPIFFKISSYAWFIRGLIYAVLFFAVEYATGWILSRVDVCPWKYDGKFAVHGLINLSYAPFWFAAGLGVEKIYPVVARFAGMV